MEVAGLAPGVFNLVHGGPEVGKILVDSKVDGIAFTGSAEVGRGIARKLQEGPFARPGLMEMGGKNPTIVMASADLTAAAEAVARAAFGLSGQKCSACSRVIIDETVHDEFLERLAEFTRTLQTGDPADPDVFLGPVINANSAARFEDAAERADREGRIVAGGRRPELPGYFVEPTVVADLPHGHELTRRELFLPFVTVTKVGSLDEALTEANAVDYGLTAGIFTEDVERLDRQGRSQFLVYPSIHARAEPDDRRLSSPTKRNEHDDRVGFHRRSCGDHRRTSHRGWPCHSTSTSAAWPRRVRGRARPAWTC
jgi:1-pyrroline-5-carboxylate dehydrogenase